MLSSSRPRRSRGSALARPAGGTAGAPQLVFQVGDLLFSLLGLGASLVELLLSGSDLGTELIFAVVDVGSIEELAVQVFDSQVENLDFFFSALHFITRFLELVSPVFFVVTFVVGRACRFCGSRCGGGRSFGRRRCGCRGR